MNDTLQNLLDDQLSANGETALDLIDCIALSKNCDGSTTDSMAIDTSDWAYPDFTAWTTSWVYYLHEYDGSYSCASIPRNPPIKKQTP